MATNDIGQEGLVAPIALIDLWECVTGFVGF
jgi:hypothetical protein